MAFRLAFALALTSISLPTPAPAQGSPPVATVAGEVLDLDRALERTRTAHPSALAAELRTRAARARIRDASRGATPALGIDFENFGGALGTDGLESTVRLEQSIERGGDRAARAGLASAEHLAADAEAGATRRELWIETAGLFIAAWTWQERAGRLAEAERDAAAALATARERLREGAAPRVEVVRAEAFLSHRGILRRRAQAELAIARRRLALQWGADSLTEARLDLPPPSAPPALDESRIAAVLASHPDARRAVAEVESEKWRLRAAEAAYATDVALSAGVRHFREAGRVAFVAGVSLPLPLGRPGTGAIEAARDRRRAAERLGEGRARVLRDAMQAAHERAESTWRAWSDLGASVRPAAEEALALVTAAYRAGRAGSLEIQEAQRARSEAELEGIEAAAEAWRARTTFEALADSRPEPSRERSLER